MVWGGGGMIDPPPDGNVIIRIIASETIVFVSVAMTNTSGDLIAADIAVGSVEGLADTPAVAVVELAGIAGAVEDMPPVEPAE